MAEKSRETLKESFKVGSKPTEQDYIDIIDSFVNKTEDNFVEVIPLLPDATTTQKGIVEQATLAEVEEGEDNTRFLTPKGAKRAVELFTPEAPVKSVNGQTGIVTVALDKANWLDFSGRFHLFTNNRWVGSNVSFGQSDSNFKQNHGTGDFPNILWNSLGIGFLPKGTVLHSLEFIGRVNNNEITDLQIQLSCQGDNLEIGGSGYDSISESENEIILPPTNLGTNAPNLADIQRHLISLGDYVLGNDRIIVFCCKPLGTISSTRYWIAQRKLHFTLP